MSAIHAAGEVDVASSRLRKLWPKLRVAVTTFFIALGLVCKLALSARLLDRGQAFHFFVLAIALFMFFGLVEHGLERLRLIDEEKPSEPAAGEPAVFVSLPPATAAPAPIVVAATLGPQIGGTIPMSISRGATASWGLEGGYDWRRGEGEGG